jgi:hypothetical protein
LADELIDIVVGLEPQALAEMVEVVNAMVAPTLDVEGFEVDRYGRSVG